MNKIMNNICTIVCNDFLNALEISFTKTGSLQEHTESMQLATDLSIIHRINFWIVQKKDFEDLKLENFLMLLYSWSKIVRNRNKAEQKINILTSGEISEKINTILKKDWWIRHYSKAKINIYAYGNDHKLKIIQQKILDNVADY